MALQHENVLLPLELQDRERRMELLSKSKGQLAQLVEGAKSVLKDVHKRNEGDLQRTVASLQDQYNSALELLQLGAGLAPSDQPKHELSQQSASSSSSLPAGAAGTSAGCCTGIQRPPCTRPPPQLPHRPAAVVSACKCQRAAPSCRCPHAAAAAPSTCGAKQPAARQPKPGADPDPRLGLLGLGADDFTPSTAYGDSMGLAAEPLAVLRDVLNLDGSRDHERELLRQQQLRQRPLSADAAASAAAAGVGLGPAGPLLAQAQFESRLRDAYRSMLLQLQHRYQLERERQEDAHKLALQEQEARQVEDLQQLAAAQEAELAKAARRLERHEAAWRAEVQRLEAQLAAAKAAAETGQSQAAAARAAAESLQAQLQLQRSTHEAELHHVRQGSMSLQEHEEVVHKLQAEWEQALQQRERDYSCLLSELGEMRRQLSCATEPSRSSGNSCGRGSTIASPLPTAAAGRPPAAAVDEEPAAPAPGPRAPVHERGRDAEGRLAADQRQQQQHTQQDPRQTQHHHQLPYANEHEHQRHYHRHRNHQHQQQHHKLQQLRVRFEPASVPGGDDTDEDRGGGGGDCGGGGRAGCSPAGSAASVAARGRVGELEEDVELDPAAQRSAGVGGAAGRREAEGQGEGSASSTPRSRAHQGPAQGRQFAGAAEAQPERPCSQLSELVGAVVHFGGSAARRGALDTDGAAERAAATSGSHILESHAFASGSSCGGGNDDDGSGCGGGVGVLRGSSGDLDDYFLRQQQQQQQRQAWTGDAGPGSSNGAYGSGGGNAGRGGAVGGSSGGGSGADLPGSPDEQASEATLGRWHGESLPSPPRRSDGDARSEAGSWAGAPPWQRLHQGQAHGQAGGLGSATGRHGAAESSGTMPTRTAAVAAAAAAGGGGEAARVRAAAAAVGVAAAKGRSPSPPRRAGSSPPPRSGRGESSWGRTGNPAAVVVLPRCLRCGLNDAISPGCCRFHPALLSQPSGLRFTPEWMACEAAGHTARTPGCFMRSEHFYEPAGLAQQRHQQTQQQQPARAASPPPSPPPAAARRQGCGNPDTATAPTRGSITGDEHNGGGGGGGGAHVLWRDRRPSGGGAAAAGSSQAPKTSPLRRPSAPSRSPVRGGARAHAAGGGVVGGGGEGAADSPSPMPRTRLPSPMRR
ncbi:hypothetical protein PLESTF_000528800 [Pleodorina starrii]|nr:hypothetical protein PLESTF_000528800 [Pleodorina starrii]